MGGQYSKPDVPIKWYNDYVAAMPSQEGKNVAITGCTSGTGLETAKAIASRGGHIFALNRPSERAVASLAAMKEACKDGGTATHIDCDLQDYASVRSAASQVKNAVQAKGLHCLLNNAGVFAECALFGASLELSHASMRVYVLTHRKCKRSASRCHIHILYWCSCE